MIAERWFKASSYALVGSGCVAAAFAGIADVPSLLCFAAVFVASWFLDTARLRRRLPAWAFPVAVLGGLCLAPADYLLLSHAEPQVLPVLLHLFWLALAARLLTRAGDSDWPLAYLLASLQWIPAALQPVGAAFWCCLAIFVTSGITALMLREVRRSAMETPGGNPRIPKANIKFPFKAFSLTVTGVALAMLAGTVPLFFLFPRLSSGGARAAHGTASPVASVGGNGAKIELGRADSSGPPDAVVMRVGTDMPRERLPHDLKWRGLAFDHYDGRAWTIRRREPQAVAVQGRFYKLEESAMGAELLRQNFFMEETSFGTVFAAHRALAVSLDAGLLQRDSSDNLLAVHTAAGNANYAVNYVAVSDLIQPDGEMIANWDDVPNGIRDAYLQLPPLDPRIDGLAHSVTLGWESRYAKARALETWLRTRYTYSLTPPEAAGDDDPLSTFLFDAKTGHCEHFATALTVMLRQIGIPARMTSGFLAGEYNPLSGSWTVRQHHAHAWTEAWFPPYGWVAFDATPPSPAQNQSAAAQFGANLADAAGFWWRKNVAGYDSSRQHNLVRGFFSGVNQWEDRTGAWLSAAGTGSRAAVDRLLSRVPPAAFALPFLVLLITVLVILVKLLRRRQRGRRHPQTAIADFYAEASQALKSRGFVRQQAQTPMEFALSLGEHPAAAVLSDLTRLYNEFRFGSPDKPFPRAEAQRLLRSLRDALR